MKSVSFFTIALLSLCVLGGCAFQAANPGDEFSSKSSESVETETPNSSNPTSVANPVNPGEERSSEDPNMPGPTPWRDRSRASSRTPNPGPEVESADKDPGMPGPTPWKNRRVEVDPYL